MARNFHTSANIAYYLAWLPLTGLVDVLLILQGIGVVPALIVGFSFSLPMAVVGGSARYMCRVLPLRRDRLLQVLPPLGGVTFLISGTWTGLFVIISRALAWLPPGDLMDIAGFLFLVSALSIDFSLVFHYLMIAMEEAQEARQRAEEAKVLSREAELRALRAQLNPHFLFNSLNSVAALTATDPAAAREMVLRMSSFFRSTLAAGRQEVFTLGEELALLRNYLDIEQVRFGERLVVREEVDASLHSLKWPPLLLQPLVENAVKHGVSPSADPVTVDIRALRDGEAAVIRVCNGRDPEARSTGGTGIGLSSSRERLSRFFGDAATMTVEAEDRMFCVTIRIDMEKLK